MSTVVFGGNPPNCSLATFHYLAEVNSDIRLEAFETLCDLYPSEGYAQPQPGNRHAGWTARWREIGVSLLHEVEGDTYYALTEGGLLWLTMNLPAGYTRT